MQKYADAPQILKDFLAYHENIKGQSKKTIEEYYLDLRMFLRFIMLMRNDMPIQTRLDDIPIKNIDLEFIKTITTSEIFDFRGRHDESILVGNYTFAKVHPRSPGWS